MDRAISFKDPLVLAIERGEKTQTRRLLRAKPTEALLRSGVPLESALRVGGEWRLQDGRWFLLDGWDNPAYADAPVEPGDRLWVKQRLVKDADGNVTYGTDGSEAVYPGTDSTVPWDWKPATLGAMYCPRWASRITLEVGAVRIQRLNDITEADAKAEGVEADLLAGETHRANFAALWDHINGAKASWASNPWVWAITFRRVVAASQEAA